MPALRKIAFTVDSHLLRELGERLVGRQYIALAELVKNSYDADATKVEIRIEDDCIVVSDNGHGMTDEDFEQRWMRVGSTHKVEEKTSRKLRRPLTGSKGVGRLAVQFLASELELISVPQETIGEEEPGRQGFRATVDWDTAVQAGDLTSADAELAPVDHGKNVFPLGKPHGTIVKLTKLKQPWKSQEFQDLASEIWFLQPPFRRLSGTSGSEIDGFNVDLFTPSEEEESLFESQMTRMIGLHKSRIVGRLLPNDGSKLGQGKRKIQMSLELELGPPQPWQFEVPVKGDDPCLIESLEFEIRIFNLSGRQARGIPVQTARDYMREWGGVHIYDAGFRIPYAGPDADWLELEVDHSHRMDRSKLLPEELQVPRGLYLLPTNGRVLGVVSIDTTREALAARCEGTPTRQHLQIQVSRDRLVSNAAFFQLRDAVRYALDYYANRLKVKQLEELEANRDVETPSSLIQNVWDVLDNHQEEVPAAVANRIRTELEKTMEAVREQSEWTKQQSGLLGAMATLGATAMAFDHQFNQQLNVLEHHAATLETLIGTTTGERDSLSAAADRIKQWIRDARNTRAMFSPIADERNRTANGRFQAKTLIESLASNIRPILRGVMIDVSEVDQDLLLPEATYPVWMAVFHNVFMNSYNAMLDSEIKRISVSSFRSRRRRGIRIQDTGAGIDLDKADFLFKPLQRAMEITPERRALGYGGTGLGLAIVRMLSTDLKADVCFMKPETPYNTSFEIAWSERP